MTRANPHRGEASIEVAGETLVLRPTFEALVAADTDRTPAPDSSSRQPPLPLLVIATASPLTDNCVVLSPATVE